MLGNLDIAERVDNADRDDPCRREAYERALRQLRGRLGLCDTLTAEQIQALRDYAGPEIAGHISDVPRRRRA